MVETAWQALQQGPAACWYLGRPHGGVQWANEAAGALGAEAPCAAPPWSEGLAAIELPAWGWEPWWSLCREALSATAPSRISRAWPRLVQGEAQLWLLNAQVQEAGVFVMAVQADAAAAHAAVPWTTRHLQRDLLVREVHHRLKNNLQGVSGLLNRQAFEHREAAPWLEAAALQLQAMAQVYGLQTSAEGAPTLMGLVQAVAQGVAAVFGVVIEVVRASTRAPAAPGPTDVSPEARALRHTLWAHLEPRPQAPDRLRPLDAVHPDQAGALALVLNELMTNAVKHCTPPPSTHGGSEGAAVRCTVCLGDAGAAVEITNAGAWSGPPEGAHAVSGVHGLGLARALLPSRGAQLHIRTESGLVCARLQIDPPVLCRGGRSPAQSDAA